ncbi:hypothetical protein DH09_12245 [Bacillaceae bacterium JMAK1]|nr:hypothetical protein DH09_12245 [Bacillaceae bacterium JMAK1]
MDVTPFLNRESTVPLYQQLIDYFKDNMHAGTLCKGMKLPSKRSLANKLHISQTTVERCYEQLLAEGYVRSHPRSGVYVDYDVVNTLHYKGNQSVPTPKHPVTTVIDFHYGHVSSEDFPLHSWKKSVSASYDFHLDRLCKPNDEFGEHSLRSLIADYVYQARGVNTSVENVYVGSTTSYLLTLLCYVLEECQRVGFEDPGYPRSREIFTLLKKEVVPLRVDHNEGVQLNDIHSTKPDLIYVTPSHHYPLGSRMTLQKREELLQSANEIGTYLIEDDFDSEFHYTTEPLPSLHALAKSDNVIYMGTFSRSFLPSLRLSYMILPKSLLPRMQKLTLLYKQTVSSSQQLALADFMERREWTIHLNKMRTMYTKKKTVLLNELKHAFGDTIHIHGHLAGPRVLIDVLLGKGEEQLIQEADAAGVKVYPTSHAYLSDAPLATLQLGFSGLTIEDIQNGIQLLKKAWVK